MSLRLEDVIDEDAKPIAKEPEPEAEEDEGRIELDDTDMDRELSFVELAQRKLCIFSFRSLAGEGHNEFEFGVIGMDGIGRTRMGKSEDRPRGRLQLSDFPQFKGCEVKVKERRLDGTRMLHYMRVDYPDGTYEIFEKEGSQIIIDLNDPDYFEYAV